MKVMLNGSRMACILALTFSAMSPCSAQEGQGRKALDGYIESSMKEWKVPGVAVAIVQGNQVVYIRGYGIRDVNTNEPVTPETLFAIGSCTKAFTTTAMAMLVDDGKMTWDDPVRKHIDFFRLSDPLADSNVSLRDLVTHRTGLDRTPLLGTGSPWTREELIRRVGNVKLAAGFREKWQYTNTMFTAAGYAVGRASGGSWEEFVKKRIFDSLGMKTADFSATDVQNTANHASPHVSMPDGTVNRIPWGNIDATGPAGSINANVREMANWVIFHLNEGRFNGVQLVSPRNMEEMHTPQMTVPYGSFEQMYFPETTQLSYGFGWFIQEYRGHHVVQHGGGVDGFTSLVGFVPEAGFGFVVLTNHSEEAHLPQIIGYRIIDSLLGLPEKNWNIFYKAQDEKSSAEELQANKDWKAKQHKNTSPSRELQAYVGTYENAAYGKAGIYLENRKLIFRFNSFTSEVEHYHFDTFTINLKTVGERIPLSFFLDKTGNIVKFTIVIGSDLQPTSTIEFTRIAGEK